MFGVFGAACLIVFVVYFVVVFGGCLGWWFVLFCLVIDFGFMVVLFGFGGL